MLKSVDRTSNHYFYFVLLFFVHAMQFNNPSWCIQFSAILLLLLFVICLIHLFVVDNFCTTGRVML